MCFFSNPSKITSPVVILSVVLWFLSSYTSHPYVPVLLRLPQFLSTRAKGYSGQVVLQNSVHLRICTSRRAIKFFGARSLHDCSRRCIVFFLYINMSTSGSTSGGRGGCTGGGNISKINGGNNANTAIPLPKFFLNISLFLSLC